MTLAQMSSTMHSCQDSLGEEFYPLDSSFLTHSLSDAQRLLSVTITIAT